MAVLKVKFKWLRAFTLRWPRTLSRRIHDYSEVMSQIFLGFTHRYVQILYPSRVPADRIYSESLRIAWNRHTRSKTIELVKTQGNTRRASHGRAYM